MGKRKREREEMGWKTETRLRACDSRTLEGTFPLMEKGVGKHKVCSVEKNAKGHSIELEVEFDI